MLCFFLRMKWGQFTTFKLQVSGKRVKKNFFKVKLPQ